MPTMTFRQLERVVRGFSNHRRIQILHLLDEQPELDVTEIAAACKINFKTASEHARRLAISGLILKRQKKTTVQHALSPRGRRALSFLNALV